MIEVSYQVNSFFQAAKEIQNMFDHVLELDTNNVSAFVGDQQTHKFQVQEVIQFCCYSYYFTLHENG
jgi:hypothetical protein